jgi:opacity protein-like surface antigen
MNYNPSFKSLLLVAACSLGLGAPAFAAENTTVVSSTPATTVDAMTHGVLGHNLANFSISYIDIDDSSVDATAYNLTLNQGLRTGLDTLFEYNYLRSEKTGAGRITEHKVNFGGRAYTNYNGFKPFVDGGIGWAWLKAPFGLSENSFLAFASVGAEFQATPELTITPSVRYWYAAKSSFSDTWDFSVKANYWVTEKIAITAKLGMDDDQNIEYGLGFNYRF